MKNKGDPMSKKKAPVKKGTPVWVWGVVILAVLVISGIVLSQALKPAQASLPLEISVSQAAEKRDQGAFILDVREQSEWDAFHIPGATLIPLGQLPDRLNEVPKNREVVVVCRTGHRSAQGRDILRNAGYTLVTSMAGGVTQWQSQGLAIEP
jgi:rhodanese-related sulfurtransferase